MIKKTVTYTDYNGVERTEDFYFNLTPAELTEMELSIEGGLTTYLKNIIVAKNVPQLIKAFKNILLASYGERSSDGRRFVKSEQITNDFVSTPAYSAIYMELVQDDEAASKFVNGLIPSDMKLSDEEIKKVELELLGK